METETTEKSTKPITEELREKIRRRAKRAFEIFDAGSNEHETRCHDVTKSSLTYRMPHENGGGAYSGRKLLIKRDAKGRIYVPKNYEPT